LSPSAIKRKLQLHITYYIYTQLQGIGVLGRALPVPRFRAQGNHARWGHESSQRPTDLRRIANRYEDEFLDGECASFRRLVSALRFLAQQLLGGPRDGLALREHVHAFVVHPPLLRHGSSGSVLRWSNR
jgi:hypothetical protein